MAFSRIKTVDKIELLPSGHIQIREKNELFDDEKPTGIFEYHRRVLAPGDPIPGDLITEFDLSKISQGTWTAPIVSRDNERKLKEKEEFDERERARAANEAADQARREEELAAEKGRIDQAVAAALEARGPRP